MADIVNITIDEPKKLNISASRSQTYKFDIRELDEVFSDECKLVWSYGKTKASVMSTKTVGDGLIKLGNGGVYTEFDLSSIRGCFDTIYGEFDGYGEGDRKLIIMINIDNSAL